MIISSCLLRIYLSIFLPLLRVRAIIFASIGLTVSICYSQSPSYDSIALQARELLKSKNYLQAATAYSRAFQTLGGKGLAQDRYDAAIAWALSAYNDSAFFNLLRLADKSDFLEFRKLQMENSFNVLRKDNRWQLLLEKINPNHEFYHDSLALLLLKIYEDDQKYRKMMDEIKYRYGNDSKEYRELIESMVRQDSNNLVNVTQTIDQYGWLSVNEVGHSGNSALWLVIQHAELSIQEKYFPVMKAAVENHKASKQNLAYLEDRILMRQGKKQLYGTQYKLDPKTGEMRLWDIDNPENLNKRRESVGLPPM